MTAGLAVAGGLVTILAGLGLFVALFVAYFRRGNNERLSQELDIERGSLASMRTDRDEWKAKAQDLSNQVERMSDNNTMMAGKLDAYERVFRAVEGPLFQLAADMGRDHTRIAQILRRLLVLLQGVLRGQGNHSAAEAVGAEIEELET